MAYPEIIKEIQEDLNKLLADEAMASLSDDILCDAIDILNKVEEIYYKVESFIEVKNYDNDRNRYYLNVYILYEEKSYTINFIVIGEKGDI